MGEMNAMVLCQHTSLVGVISAALGGSSSSKPADEVDLTSGGGSFDTTINRINALYPI